MPYSQKSLLVFSKNLSGWLYTIRHNVHSCFITDWNRGMLQNFLWILEKSIFNCSSNYQIRSIDISNDCILHQKRNRKKINMPYRSINNEWANYLDYFVTVIYHKLLPSTSWLVQNYQKSFPQVCQARNWHKDGIIFYMYDVNMYMSVFESWFHFFS